jgi:hypothetical protein
MAQVAGAAKTPEARAAQSRQVVAIGAKRRRDARSGIRVLACRNTMGHWAQDFAKETGENVGS